MTLDRISIRLPWPDPALFPNRKSGRHWAATFKQKVSAREGGFWAAKQAAGGAKLLKGRRYPVSIVFEARDKRKRDLDGLLGSLKHSLDGIALALGIDDSQFRPVTLDDRPGDGSVIVEIST